MSQTKFDEVAFNKQLNVFEAAMQDDLDERANQAALKWEFNFATHQPTHQKTFSWEPVQTQQEQTRPRLQISKPKMSLGSITELGQISKGELTGSRVSFLNSFTTESTAAGESMLGSSIGKNGSLVDFGLSFGRSTAFARTSTKRR